METRAHQTVTTTLTANDILRLVGYPQSNNTTVEFQSDQVTIKHTVPVTTDYKTVWLREIGNKKISVIKVVREVAGIGLKDAKDLVESAPAIIAIMPRDVATKTVHELTAVGATADLDG